MPKRRQSLDRDENGQFTVPDPELQALGRQIGETYRRLLLDRYGVEQRLGARHEVILYRAAQLMKSRELTVDEFVTRQLAQMAIQGTFWPQALASWATAERADQHQRADEPAQLARYIAQLLLAARLRALYGPTIYRDPMWPFSPVIRSILAARAGDQAYVETIRNAVRLETAQHPVARTLLEFR